jgi:hypothetical protein
MVRSIATTSCGRSNGTAADRLEEVLEAGRRDHPEHHEVVGAVVVDLVLDVVAQEARRARDQVVADAVDHDAPGAPEAHLQFDLTPVGVLANVRPRGHRLKAHAEAVIACVRRVELGVGVAIGGDGLPVRDAVLRLHDDGVASDRLGVAHGGLLSARA